MTFPRYGGREFESAISFDMDDFHDSHAFATLLDTLVGWYAQAVADPDGEVLVDAIGETGFRHFRFEEIDVRAAVVAVTERSRVVFMTISPREFYEEHRSAEETEYPYARRNEDALVQCVLCGTAFGAEGGRSPSVGGANALYGPVADVETGEEIEEVGQSSGDEFLAHEDCYEEYSIEKLKAEHHTLDSFAVGENGGSA